MKYSDVTELALVKAPLNSDDKFVVMRELAQSFVDAGILSDADDVYEHFVELEARYGSWAFFKEPVAFPHWRAECFERPRMAVGISNSGIDWDGTHVHVVLMTIAPQSNIWHELNRDLIHPMLKYDVLLQFLRQCTTPEEVIEVLTEADEWSSE